jgi:hypothetical protein
MRTSSPAAGPKSHNRHGQFAAGYILTEDAQPEALHLEAATFGEADLAVELDTVFRS